MDLWPATSKMESPRILLPVDLRHCSVDVFNWINRLARHTSVRLVLLNVVNLNALLPDDRAYEELGREALRYLGRVSEYLHPSISRRLRIRMGRVAEEIMAEAKAERPEVVLLTTRQASSSIRRWPLWNARSALLRTVATRLADEVRCNVIILPASSYLDCASTWGSPERSDRACLPAQNGIASAPSLDEVERSFTKF